MCLNISNIHRVCVHTSTVNLSTAYVYTYIKEQSVTHTCKQNQSGIHYALVIYIFNNIHIHLTDTFLETVFLFKK